MMLIEEKIEARAFGWFEQARLQVVQQGLLLGGWFAESSVHVREGKKLRTKSSAPNGNHREDNRLPPAKNWPCVPGAETQARSQSANFAT